MRAFSKGAWACWGWYRAACHILAAAGLLLRVLPKPLKAGAAMFPCDHIPAIHLLYKTGTVVCVERLAGGMKRLFTIVHVPMYGQFGEAPPPGLQENMGMDPSLGLPLCCVGSVQELLQLSRSLCLHAFSWGEHRSAVSHMQVRGKDLQSSMIKESLQIVF